MPGLPRSKNGIMCLEINLTIPTKDDLIETVNACESKLEKAIFWLEFPVYGIFEEKEGVSEKANIISNLLQEISGTRASSYKENHRDFQEINLSKKGSF